MIIVMEQGAGEEQIERVIEKLVNLGFSVHRSSGVVHTVLGGVGPDEFDPEEINVLPGVQSCHRVMAPYKLASRSFRPEGTVVRAGNAEIGGKQVVVMAGPAGVESEESVLRAAEAAAGAGARFLHSGAAKRRFSPHLLESLDERHLEQLRRSAERFGLNVVSEVTDPARIGLFEQYVDVLQVGSRNMQNFDLLRALGAARKPVLLKRSPGATVEELLLSADCILAGGNYNVILCERGIRTFETGSRFTMDVTAIPVVKRLSHLPILADPSQATGRRDKVIPMGRAAVAAGADGLVVELHPDPDNALSEGAQSLYPDQFTELMRQCRLIASAVGRSL